MLCVDLQTLKALKKGQDAIGFYHRDLHAANIMEHLSPESGPTSKALEAPGPNPAVQDGSIREVGGLPAVALATRIFAPVKGRGPLHRPAGEEGPSKAVQPGLEVSDRCGIGHMARSGRLLC